MSIIVFSIKVKEIEENERLFVKVPFLFESFPFFRVLSWNQTRDQIVTFQVCLFGRFLIFFYRLSFCTPLSACRVIPPHFQFSSTYKGKWIKNINVIVS